MNGVKVLLVDDMQSLRWPVSLALRMLGCCVVETSSAEAKQDAVRHGDAKLAFFRLRGACDAGLLAELRALRGDLTVLGLTECCSDDEIEALRGSGAAGVVIQPIGPTALRKALRALASKQAEDRRPCAS
jgi:DNA-binding response OmpR family regulator